MKPGQKLSALCYSRSSKAGTKPLDLVLYDRRLKLICGLYIVHMYIDRDLKVITWSAIC
jgi:hypothetical protein